MNILAKSVFRFGLFFIYTYTNYYDFLRYFQGRANKKLPILQIIIVTTSMLLAALQPPYSFLAKITQQLSI